MAKNKNNKKKYNNFDKSLSSDGSFQNTPRNNNNNKKNKHEDIIATLNARIEAETPARGTVPYSNQKNAVVAFGSLPISPETLQGLTIPKSSSKNKSSPYTTLTEIQARSIPHALAGRDILGAAKTGSGKTLAFLIPLLEKLYRQRWTRGEDGIGGIVLSPTRELAGQIYSVLQTIGRFHSHLSIGLLIGGHNPKRQNKLMATQFQQEQMAIPTTNILICTPGRLLQHLEQTPYMMVDNLQMLILDEADRILDMGFRNALLRILEYLPTAEASGRQTLLFSATQTKTVKDLAVLSINRKTVEYIGISNNNNNNNKEENENDDNDKNKTENDNNDKTTSTSTPDRLKQAYVIVPIQHKLNCLYSFLKSHLQHKTIAFLASCSQVRFVWDLFCRLRPGLSVLALHGKLSQTKRLQVYDKFSNTPHCVLFATDVAARGLDFPNVDWVVQVDAPEDKDMYVHRVGRTARFKNKGQALLLLDPMEEATIQSWWGSGNGNGTTTTTLKKKSINPTKTVLVTQRAASLVAEHNSLHALAKKSFFSYTRSLSLLPKSVWNDPEWNVLNLDLEAYAASLGLGKMPSLDYLKHVSNRETVRETKNVNRKLQKLKEQIKLEKESKKKKKRKVEESENMDDDDDDMDGLLVVKARHEPTTTTTTTTLVDGDLGTTTTTNRRDAKKIRIDGGGGVLKTNQHVIFGDDGDAFEKPKLLSAAINNHNNKENGNDSIPDDLAGANESYMERVRKRLEETKDLDKQEERERIRAKHKKKKNQERMEREGGEGNDNNGGGDYMVATLGRDSDDDDDDDSSSASEESNDGDNGDDSSASSGSDSSSEDDDSSASSSSSDDDNDVDIAAQEDLALSLIRGSA